MKPRFPSLLLLPLLLVAGCGLSSEEEDRLSGFYFRAERYYLDGKLVQAQDQVDRGLAIDPENQEFQMLKGYILMARYDRNQDLQTLEEARDLFRRATSAGLFASPRREALLGLGRCLQKLAIAHRRWARRVEGRLQEGLIRMADRPEAKRRVDKRRALARTSLAGAEKLFLRLRERNPDDIHATFHLALVSIDLGKVDRGAKLLEHYIPIAQRRRESLQGPELKRTYSQKERERKLNTARSLRDRLVEARGLLANIAFERGDYERAAKELTALLELDPNRFNEYYNRGRCYYRLGLKEEARKDLELFVGRSTLPQEDPRIKQALTWLGELRAGGE